MFFHICLYVLYTCVIRIIYVLYVFVLNAPASCWPGLVAVGGGAFVQPETRALIQEKGISIWLRATMPQVMERIQANANRPLLKQGDPAEILAKLMEVRYPIYAEAAITVDSLDGAMYLTVQAIANALNQYLSEQPR